MFSYVLSSAPSFWRPSRILEKHAAGTEGLQTMITRTSHQPSSEMGSRIILAMTSTTSLGFHALGTWTSRTLRQAYLSRSKACHPERFSFHSTDHADNTLKGVLRSVLCGFLDGNLEMCIFGDLRPSLELSDESIDSVLAVLAESGERVLTCRTCVVALHAECIRVLELQSAFRRLPYSTSLVARVSPSNSHASPSRYLSLLENAIQEQRSDAGLHQQQPTNHDRDNQEVVLLPRKVSLLIRALT
ncbi:DnaJ-domain-containing protein, partial [Pisolithus marmoratus]